MSEGYPPTPDCPHIDSLFEESELLTKYKTAITWNVRRFQKPKNPAKRRKISMPACGTCELSLARPIVCLHCPYSGCWKDEHISQHQADEGHLFSADVKTGSVFCTECDNFIIDSRVDQVYLNTVITAEEQQAQFQVGKKTREPFQAWTPSDKDTSALEDAASIPCQERRGLLNLGQTCFMNAILQSFAHNPLLRNYFLSDKHNWKLCKSLNCTCCEMDKFFAEIYANDPTPYGPTSFLATIWRASPELAGYAQRDAHEFFITALNQIHTTSRGSTNVSCNCVIHSTFAGQLQSDVTCERCGNVTSTVDPMLDISLELKRKAGDTVAAENTLAACLRRFTQPEKLGPKEYSCGKCGKAAHEAHKRLSIRKLPPVLSFQFKRFEHKSADKSAARKIDTPVRFPASFSMAPYTTAVMKEMEKDGSGAVFS
ncbi:hypothetical protein HGRIS_000980 [Hohenbuehelia grisea]